MKPRKDNDMSNTVRDALAELVACAEVSVPYTTLNTAG